jgi:hypothetical protein
MGDQYIRQGESFAESATADQIREAYRVLARGGRLAISNVVAISDLPRAIAQDPAGDLLLRGAEGPVRGAMAAARATGDRRHHQRHVFAPFWALAGTISGRAQQFRACAFMSNTDNIGYDV